MEVILLERVEKLGQMGDLVTVKPGYARNFLLPKGKALRATETNKQRFEADRAKLEAENLARKSDAEKVAAKVEGMAIVLVRAASEMGQLYGSASSRDIAAGITEAGVAVNRNQIDLNTAIKTLGLFPVRVVLHPEITVEVTVNVARSEDEAAEQQRLGRAIISDIAERERAEAAEAALEAGERIAAQDDEDGEARDDGAGQDDAPAGTDAGDAEADAGGTDAGGAAKAKKAKAKTKTKTKAKAKAAAGDGEAESEVKPKAKAKKAKSAAKTKTKTKAKAKTTAKAKTAAKAKAKAKAAEKQD